LPAAVVDVEITNARLRRRMENLGDLKRKEKKARLLDLVPTRRKIAKNPRCGVVDEVGIKFSRDDTIVATGESGNWRALTSSKKRQNFSSWGTTLVTPQ